MKSTIQRFRTTLTATFIILATVALAANFTLQKAFAATGTMYITPASASVQKDNTITLTVRINPGTAVNTVHTVVNYNAAALTYQSMSYAGSPFDNQITPSISSGNLTFDQVDLTSTVSTDSFIASIVFKANLGSGSSPVTLTGSNAAAAGTPTNPGVTGTTVSFTTPAVVTPPVTTPTTPPTTTTPPKSGGTKTTPTPTSPTTTTLPTTTTPATPDTTPTPVTVSDPEVGFTDAKISASSTAPTKVYVRFGIDGQLTSQSAVSDFATAHDVTIDPALLVPGTTYSYIVVATNQQGIETQSKLATFHTRGMLIAVRVLDSSSKPLKHKKVTLHSEPQTATTDDQGNATFTDVAAGNHSVIYTAGKQQYSKPIAVLNNIRLVNSKQVVDKQNFAVALNVKQGSGAAAPVSITLLLLAMVAGVGYVIWWRKRNNIAMPSLSFAAVTSSTPNPEPQPQPTNVALTQPSHQDFLHRRSAPEPGSVITPKDDDMNGGGSL